MSNIILFGLSADPVHLGHLKTIEFLGQKYPDHQIIIMPCKNNPIPKMQNLQTDGELRLKMLQDIENNSHVPYLKNVIISDYEILKTTPSYTIETIDYILAKYHPQTIRLVLGSDNFEQFPKWKEFKRILELTHLLIIQRPGVKNHLYQFIKGYGYNVHFLLDMPKELSPYHYDFIFTSKSQKLYYVYDNDHLEELPYDVQKEKLFQTTPKNILHLDTKLTIKLFNQAKWPQLFESKLKQGQIEEMIGPQINISSSQIRAWFREGEFQKMAKFLLPITYRSLRKYYINNQLSNDYLNASSPLKSIPTVEELFK